MVSVSNIEMPVPRFISWDELNAIKDRYQRLPQGDYFLNENDIVCQFVDHKLDLINKPIVKLIHPGLQDLFLNLRSDLEKLIKHIEEADIENDRLCKMLDEKEREEESVETSKNR